ncbi:MAG TPA: methyltransferase domain-containing protein [Burkholderiaceae bacterium]|nr:methyltransferase domain-containing protein [Burkholderiaceae bacterium]
MAHTTAQTAQVARPPAEVYEAEFVPALFRPFSTVVADAARIASGQRVLDVACGTGVLARTVAARVGASGAVLGLDANPEMLAVARRLDRGIEWIEGRAEALPLPAASVDAVVSQFGLMFFDDRVAALREMHRVLRHGGRLAVAVCDAVERSPGYGALAALLQTLFGERVAGAFRAPFAIGDATLLGTLAAQAGLPSAEVLSRSATVRFASIDALVSTERACIWTLGGLLDDAQFERLLHEARRVLAPFEQRDGSVAFEMPALIISARGT